MSVAGTVDFEKVFSANICMIEVKVIKKEKGKIVLSFIRITLIKIVKQFQSENH